MIYLDMDGVLADFKRGVLELCHMEAQDQNGKMDPETENRMWERIRKTDHFYSKLELLPGAKEMFDAIYAKYKSRCEILTGVPRPERGIITAGPDKIEWTHRLLSPKVKVNIVLRKEKKYFCKGPEDILIDDYEKNTREWQAAGGTAILHTSAENTLKQMKELGIL